MKVILRQTVENLGKPGEVVRVKPGYAHNFLIPQQMALPVTEGNIRRIESERKRLALREATLKANAEEIARSFGGMTLEFVKRAGVEGVLYGSVTTSEIAEALEKKGLEDVDRRNIILFEPIKRIGDFEAMLRLHPEVDLEIRIHVKSEDGMAEKMMAEAAAAVAEQAKAVPVAADESPAESGPAEAEAETETVEEEMEAGNEE